MRHKGMKPRKTAPRRGQRAVTAALATAEQYSLFAASPAAGEPDRRHFQRQAQLCQRLIGSLHQPELVELLSRLEAEYQAKAEPVPAEGEAAPS